WPRWRLSAPAELEAALGPGGEPPDVRAVEDDDRAGGSAGERDHRPWVAEHGGERRERQAGDDRRERRVAEERERQDPDPGTDPAHDRRHPQERAAGRRDDLATAPQPQEQRPPVTEHRRAAREDAGKMRVRLRRDQRRDEALRGVHQHDRQPVPAPVDPPHVRPADVAAAERADVRALESADDPVAGRDAAGQVAGDDQDRQRQRAGTPYPVTQPLTTPQSRLSKKASMYEARSVW